MSGQGGTWFNRAVAERLARPAESCALTQREKQVLQLVCDGLTNKQIAQALGIKPRTVEYHLDRIFKRMNASGRAAAAALAERMGWLK